MVLVLVTSVIVLSGTLTFPRSGPVPSGTRSLAGPAPFTSESYVISFAESGLPVGTNWSVSIWPAGTNSSITAVQGNSTTPSIRFSEPNGSYTYAIAAVPGYTSAPQGNISVAGGPSTVPVTYTLASPSSGGSIWSGGNYSLYEFAPGWYVAAYRAYNGSVGWVSEFASVRIAALAEVEPSGEVSEISGSPLGGASTVTYGYAPPFGTNVTNTFTLPVGPAIGLNSSDGQPDGEVPEWNASYLPGEGGATMWGKASGSPSTVTVSVTFQFTNGTHPNVVKFDVVVSDWQWLDTTDALGIAVESVMDASPGGSRFVYDPAAGTFTATWNSNGTPISTLRFGTSANTTSPAFAPLSVTDQGGVFWEGEMALALLTFSGARGYSNMSYDPWIDFGVSGTVPLGPSSPGAPAAIPWGDAAAPILLAGLAGAVLFGYSRRVRRRPIEDGLASIA